MLAERRQMKDIFQKHCFESIVAATDSLSCQTFVRFDCVSATVEYISRFEQLDAVGVAKLRWRFWRAFFACRVLNLSVECQANLEDVGRPAESVKQPGPEMISPGAARC